MAAQFANSKNKKEYCRWLRSTTVIKLSPVSMSSSNAAQAHWILLHGQFKHSSKNEKKKSLGKMRVKDMSKTCLISKHFESCVLIIPYTISSHQIWYGKKYYFFFLSIFARPIIVINMIICCCTGFGQASKIILWLWFDIARHFVHFR